MKAMLLGTAAAVLAAVVPAQAVEPVQGARLGTEAAAIATAIGEDGWHMTRFERERGRIEVTAHKDGQRIEAHLDAATGEVMRIEGHGGKSPGDGQLRRMLADQGFDIVRYERERRYVEVYANRDGQRWELKVDPVDGRILDMEREDD